jgi:hypothetical protein
MGAEGLIPRVQNHRPAYLPTKGLVAKLEEGLPHRLEQQREQWSWVA